MRSPITVPPTPNGKAEAKPIEIASAPPAFFQSALTEVPVAPPLLVSGQPLISSRPAAIEAPTRPFVPASQVGIEKPSVNPIPEQLASLPNKPIEAAPAKAVVARPASPKPLEGFIIQLAFNDKERAQRWAEGMEKKGFAVSVTEAGNDGALRVRLGNFVLRDDAERQLKAIKQDGLAGIILNLPQAFRPEARTSIP
ncbi:MAG TPA: SPOR domain-containing protein [Candidatus Limnocylindrales bacterium]|nr:SPOR domain-containing protein [Candidatus Limnocylindrales bacterium]